MKTVPLAALLFPLCSLILFSPRQEPHPGYIVQREKDLAVEEPGTHGGGGLTTGYSFFSKTPGLKLVFRKRILHPGSAIGYHEQKNDEVYYILEGSGVMRMNGREFTVNAGDAILTRPGSSHSLRPNDKTPLTLFIVYEEDPS